MDWVYPHIARLRRMLRRRGQSIDDTDDVMQELFVRILASHRVGDEIDDPEAFLARVVLNLSTNAYAKKHTELYASQSVDELGLADRSFAPDELASHDQCLERLQGTLDTLEERTRNAYLLHRIHGLTYEQIGEQLDMTVRTVENRIARAMQALANTMQRA